jgi:hypothetical protein
VESCGYSSGVAHLDGAGAVNKKKKIGFTVKEKLTPYGKKAENKFWADSRVLFDNYI